METGATSGRRNSSPLSVPVKGGIFTWGNASCCDCGGGGSDRGGDIDNDVADDDEDDDGGGDDGGDGDAGGGGAGVLALFTVAARDIMRFFRAHGFDCNHWATTGNSTTCVV